MAQVIVVGGGLAGLSAAHTLLERGANVLLLDKQGYVFLSLIFFPFSLATTFVTTLTFSFMGGNSTKATSGINGAGTQTQQDHGIADSSKIFFDDTKHSVRILWISGSNSTEILVLCRLVISRVMTSSTSSLAAQATP